jgi:membrane fusion protein (multidrug efflux system)
MSASQTSTGPAPASVSNVGNKPTNSRGPWFLAAAFVVLAIALFFVVDYVVDVMTHESTDDAFIAGHVVGVAPRISGQVLRVNVTDNQLVHSNDVLLEIDPADYAMTVAQKQSVADSQSGNYKTMLAAYELMTAKVATAEAAARKAKDDETSAQATAKQAQLDFDRARGLRDKNTISQQEFDAADAVNTKAQADYKSAQENSAEELSKIDEADRQVTAAREEAATALAQYSESRTNIAAAQLNLSYTKIVAATDGRVTRKSVEAGDYVQAGQELFSLVPVEVWLVANFKESQLKKMSPGQQAEVTIDALGGRKFKAHVESLQAGSGAQFSLLPPENATGNFVKVIQRVPVKIVFDEALPADRVIGPGMSVTPSVRVSPFTMATGIEVLAAVMLAGLITALVAILRRPSIGS